MRRSIQTSFRNCAHGSLLDWQQKEAYCQKCFGLTKSHVTVYELCQHASNMSTNACESQIMEVLNSFKSSITRRNSWIDVRLSKCLPGKYNVDMPDDSNFTIQAEVRSTDNGKQQLRFGDITCQTYPG